MTVTQARESKSLESSKSIEDANRPFGQSQASASGSGDPECQWCGSPTPHMVATSRRLGSSVDSPVLARTATVSNGRCRTRKTTLPFVPPFREHHRLQCRDSEPCFRACCAPTACLKTRACCNATLNALCTVDSDACQRSGLPVSGQFRTAVDGKNKLPSDAPGSSRILSMQRARERNVTTTAEHILFVERDAREHLTLQRLREPRWHDGRTIFCALAAAHGDRSTAEVEVLDTQRHAFRHTQTGAIQQLGHQAWCTTHLAQDFPDFINGQTTGNLLLCWTRRRPSRCPTSMSSTSRYRNMSAFSACDCVDAATLRSVAR